MKQIILFLAASVCIVSILLAVVTDVNHGHGAHGEAPHAEAVAGVHKENAVANMDGESVPVEVAEPVSVPENVAAGEASLVDGGAEVAAAQEAQD